MFDLDLYKRIRQILGVLTTSIQIRWMSDHEKHLSFHDKKQKQFSHEQTEIYRFMQTMTPEDLELHDYIVNEYAPYFDIKLYDQFMPKIVNSYVCM